MATVNGVTAVTIPTGGNRHSQRLRIVNTGDVPVICKDASPAGNLQPESGKGISGVFIAPGDRHDWQSIVSYQTGTPKNTVWVMSIGGAGEIELVRDF